LQISRNKLLILIVFNWQIS